MAAAWLVSRQSCLDFWHSYREILIVVSCATYLFLRLFVFSSSRAQRLEKGLQGPAQPGRSQWTGEKVQILESPAPWKSDVKVKEPSSPSGGRRFRTEPKKVRGVKIRRASPISDLRKKIPRIKPHVFFSSVTGSTEARAKSVVEGLQALALKNEQVLIPAELHDLSEIDYDDYFITSTKTPNDTKHFYLIIVPTYNIDTALDAFLEHLSETHNDFRIDTAPLAGLAGFSVFGFGDKESWPNEGSGFCSQARDIDRWMAKLTNRKRAFPLGLGDVKSDAAERLSEWRLGLEDTLITIATEGFLGEGVPGSGDPLESDEEDPDDSEDVVGNMPSTKRSKKPANSALDDLEDLGARVPSRGSFNAPIPIDFTTIGQSSPDSTIIPALKAMVPATSPTHAALTKQGYTIIGTHSGVKICRWTKSALRGRGSCYKHSFYGIASHLCMETTPSLSCSNKCVFCWRHGTNPVGTTWRWQVDPPEMIFKGAVEGHLKKIKALRGVPGVRAERFQEAMHIRHCALSLVGEPIFYPHINEFVGLLHKEHISSFLVCNAQHPEQLANLKHVTQLYVSIDASNKDALRKIDRPLHRDFWERFCACLDILAKRRNTMRTVYRLTLVKGFNLDEEAEGYAELVVRGKPCFVEIKGVTYCGTSTSASAGISMQNVPFWEEVQAFVLALHKALKRRGLDYGMAAEHAHSCCALLAEERFKKDGKWCTVIDYERYFQLLESGEEFGPEDYMGEPTPEWALWGKGGFDPSDVRVDRKGRKIDTGKVVEVET